jgi:hypothetical protein
MTGRISMKFVREFMTLESNPQEYIFISYTWHYQRGGSSNSWDGAMRTPLPMILSACILTVSLLIKVISGDIRLYACKNSGMGQWVFIKLVKDFMPLELSPQTYSLIS